jgi:predicted protein tyrosine phosphatase
VKLTILGRAKAGKALLSTSSTITHVISIADFNGDGNRGKPPSGFFKNLKKLFLQFDDVDHPDEKNPPTDEIIQRIIDFGEMLKKDCEKNECHLLTNCIAGICRSTAAAFIVLCVVLGEGKEFEAIDMVFGAQPDACPNPLMVSIADRLLKRKGAMPQSIWMRRNSEHPAYPVMR